MVDIGALITTLKEYITLSKEIKDIKNVLSDLGSNTGLLQEDIERFYEPLYKDLQEVKDQINKNENIEKISWDNSILRDLHLPEKLEKSKKRLLKLNDIINKTVDTFNALGHSCERIIRETTRESKLHLIDNDKTKKVIEEVGIKLAYVALGYKQSLDKTGLDKLIKEFTESQDNEINSAQSIRLKQEQQLVIQSIMTKIRSLENQVTIKDYLKKRKEVFHLITEVEETLKKTVRQFKSEQKKK